MSHQDKNFIADLKAGKREALTRFYDRLVSASSDEYFWAYLTSLVQGRDGEMCALRRKIDPRGFDWFVKHASAQMLLVFLSAAMGLAACGNSGPDPIPVPVSQPQKPAKKETVSAEPKGTESPAEGPEVMLPTPPTAAELKAQLMAYIKKAQLPATEKRRLLDVADRAPKGKMIDSEADLAQLFLKSDPKEIADALEAMVMFKKSERKWQPAMGQLYKGADFS
jgi:hypothetical protein